MPGSNDAGVALGGVGHGEPLEDVVPVGAQDLGEVAPLVGMAGQGSDDSAFDHLIHP